MSRKRGYRSGKTRKANSRRCSGSTVRVPLPQGSGTGQPAKRPAIRSPGGRPCLPSVRRRPELASRWSAKRSCSSSGWNEVKPGRKTAFERVPVVRISACRKSAVLQKSVYSCPFARPPGHESDDWNQRSRSLRNQEPIITNAKNSYLELVTRRLVIITPRKSCGV